MKYTHLAFIILAVLATSFALPAENSTELTLQSIGSYEEFARIKAELFQQRLAERGLPTNATDKIAPTATLSSPIAKRSFIKCEDNPGRTLEPTDLEVVTKFFGDWCNAGNKVPPYHGYYANWHDARVSICNYGWYNPCSRKEIDDAWHRMDVECGLKDKKPVTGYWYEPDWAKAYERTSCIGSQVCGRSGIACEDSGNAQSIGISGK